MNEETIMDKIVSLSKRRGFIYPGSEIYGGLSGTWDYGPLGVALKNKKAWEASGHVTGFSDPLIECKKCKRRFRTDQVSDPSTPFDKTQAKSLRARKCPECGGSLGDTRQFNMMFKTHIGAAEDESSVSYLRPETAGGIFVNFK